MPTASISAPTGQQADSEEISESRGSRVWAYVFSIGLMAGLFVADIVLPRGATTAIGFCLIPPLAVVTGRAGFLLGMTIACSLLTWIGYFVEPAGAPWWTSMFDRSLVIAILWLIFVLVRHRMVIISLLEHRTKMLSDVKSHWSDLITNCRVLHRWLLMTSARP